MPTRQDAPPRAIRADELKSIVGDIDEAKVIEILKLNPSVAELEEAAVWAAGDGDVLDKQGRPLTGTAALIFDILTADEEEPPPVH